MRDPQFSSMLELLAELKQGQCGSVQEIVQIINLGHDPDLNQN